MKQTIGLSQFTDAFMSIRPNNFSHEGLEILFQGIEEFEEDTNEEMELDVIALCCDFSEMTAEEVMASYNLDQNEDIAEFLNMNTWLIGETDKNTYVFRQF